MTYHRPVLALLMALLLSSGSVAQNIPTGNDFKTAESVVRALYDIVTFPAGTTPDWDAARATFIPQGIVVMRTGPDSTAILSVEGWIADFISFIEGRNVKETGFNETVLDVNTTRMGAIASVRVLYESELPPYPARQGVDFFHVIERDGRWWIVSILNELPRWGNEVPAELEE
jgi:hypothetical protein